MTFFGIFVVGIFLNLDFFWEKNHSKDVLDK
jgi:hypothetical protein